MDQGIAIILAAGVSTILGGTIALISSYYTSKQYYKQAVFSQLSSKQIESAEELAMLLFKLLSGEKLSDKNWENYLKSAYWLPPKQRDICIRLISEKENTELTKETYIEIINFIENLQNI